MGHWTPTGIEPMDYDDDDDDPPSSQKHLLHTKLKLLMICF